MKFNELGLSEKVLKAVEASGYDTPTPIQEQAIPLRPARAATFSASPRPAPARPPPSPCRCCRRSSKGRARARMPRTLILEPTRELAAQVEEAFGKYGVNHKLNLALLIGGVSFGDQEAKITRGADVADRDAGPPARLRRSRQDPAPERHRDPGDRRSRPDARHGLHSRHRAHLQAGAVHPPDAVLLGDHAAGNHPPHRGLPAQSGARRSVARRHRPPRTSPSRWCARAARPRRSATTLRRLIRGAENFKNALIFCNRKRDVQVVYRSLEKHGFSVGALHGDLDQRIAHGGARRVPQRRGATAGLLRRRRARPRHSRRQPRHQLRRARITPRITSIASAAPAAPASSASR